MQRGFIEASGHAVIKLRKREKRPLGVIFIDLAKAFDVVFHKHNLEALESKGVNELIRWLVADSYNGCYTRVTTGMATTGKMGLKGVKHSDPLSSHAFQPENRTQGGFSTNDVNPRDMATVAWRSKELEWSPNADADGVSNDWL